MITDRLEVSSDAEALKVFPIASTRSNSPLVGAAFLLPIIVFFPGLAVVVVFAYLKSPRGSAETSAMIWIIAGLIALVASACAVSVAFARMPRITTTFEVDRRGLRVRSRFHGRTFPLEVLKVDEARIVDRADAARFAPLRSAGPMLGINWPGSCTGHYKLSNGSIALLYLAYPFVGPIVILPTTGPHDLILSPADPAGFLEELRNPTPSVDASIAGKVGPDHIPGQDAPLVG